MYDCSTMVRKSYWKITNLLKRLVLEQADTFRGTLLAQPISTIMQGSCLLSAQYIVTNIIVEVIHV